MDKLYSKMSFLPVTLSAHTIINIYNKNKKKYFKANRYSELLTSIKLLFSLFIAQFLKYCLFNGRTLCNTLSTLERENDDLNLNIYKLFHIKH